MTIGSTNSTTDTKVDPVYTESGSVQGEFGVDLKGIKGGNSVTLTKGTSKGGNQHLVSSTDFDQKTVPIPGEEIWTFLFNIPSQPVAQRIKQVRAHEGWR